MPGTGAIYSVAIHENIMYLGANQGLFAKPLGSSSKDITLVPGTQSQTWDCRVIDNNLFAGHNQGTFLVNGLHAKLISEHSGGFAIRRDNQNPGLLIQCTYNNLVTYEKNGSNYQYRGQINGFADLIRYIEIDHLGNIWASHMRRGVYKIITDDQRENVLDTTYYGESTFGKDHSIQVFKIENRIVFTSNEMIYTYDDLNDTILPYETLNSAIGKYKTSHRIIEAPNHHYWFIGDSYIGLFSIFQDEIQLIKEYPTSLFDEKAVDLWENESRNYKFSFVVSPPWYASKLAIVLYFVLLILLLLLFRMWGVRHTKKREKQQHEERERELIRLRNEKLRNEIEHKSKELANSTMSIIKKNEFLLNLKKIVDKQKAELGSRYPDKYFNYLNKKIDENISNQDDWQIFETNFESAHQQFFKKIKDNYPDLTSSDLRLCAYLRMNLSSKEIAPLLGISVRGVENHRYRLRKKLNLEHDESLTDTILSL